MNKVSVIVPAHNVEGKIGKCIESLLAQNIRDIEIIVIDDASTDNTLQELEKFSKDSRVKILINEQNMGTGYTRNRGLECATGDYITFVDADDFVMTGAYEKVLTAVYENNNPDMLRYNQEFMFKIHNRQININFLNTNVFNNVRGVIVPRKRPDYIALEFPDVLNKFFRRDLIGDSRFPTTKFEDYPFAMSVISKARKLVFVPEAQYMYYSSLKFDNTTLSDVKRPNTGLLDLYKSCDAFEMECERLHTLDSIKSAVMGSQKIRSMQTTRNILFSTKYSVRQKEEIINNLIRLTTLKYGDVFDDEYYLMLKRLKQSYKMRMGYIEKFIYNEDFETKEDVPELEAHIKRLLK